MSILSQKGLKKAHIYFTNNPGDEVLQRLGDNFVLGKCYTDADGEIHLQYLETLTSVDLSCIGDSELFDLE